MTTEVENGIGGSISGYEELVYENIVYNENNIKPIVMSPNENYGITKITINGEKLDFSLENIGDSYIIPEGFFRNVKEDIHIIVSYTRLDELLKITKVDRNDESLKLEGAKFNIEYIETRSNTNYVGGLIQSGSNYFVKSLKNKVTNVLGTMTKNGTYYFTNSGGKYVSNNTSSYSTAHSYMKIDLTGKTGQYCVVVNATTTGTSTYAHGFARISQNTSTLGYSNTIGRFIYTTGATSATDYYSEVLEGGNIYYVQFGYYRYNVTGKFTINSVNVYEAETDTYGFKQNGKKYVSNNQGVDNTTANSYIPIDLTNTFGKYSLTINAEISSQNYDYGYVTITDTPEVPTYSNANGRLIYISGSQNATDYKKILDAGKIYYVHFGYYKNESLNSGSDTFTINSINLSLNTDYCFNGEVTTNSIGEVKIGTAQGKYKITEIEAPYGYELDNEEHYVIVDSESNNEIIITNKTSTLTINKVDSDDNSKLLAGAKFNVEKIKDYNDIFGKLTQNGEYYFKDYNGKYMPNNTSVNQIANSYIPVNLSNEDGEYYVVINMEGYSNMGATISNNTNPIENISYYSTDSFAWINGGGLQGQNYTSNVLEGGREYYLKFASEKWSTTSLNYNRINSIRLFKKVEDCSEYLSELMVNNDTRTFIKNGDKIELSSTENNKESANAYLEIDLTDKIGTYNIIANVNKLVLNNGTIKASITDGTEALTDYSPFRQFMYMNSNTENIKCVSEPLEGGKKYYLQLSYSGGDSSNEIIIDSIGLAKSEVVEIFVNNYEDKNSVLNTNKYFGNIYNNNEPQYKSFEQNDNKIVSISSSNTVGCIEVDLTDKEGNYNVLINTNIDQGNLVASIKTTDSLYSDFSPYTKFVYISGSAPNNKIYSSPVLNGGQKYYIHLYSPGGNSVEIDKIELAQNSNIEKFENNDLSEVFGTVINNGDYYFEYQDGKLIPNNNNNEPNLANSYIPIDLRNKEGKYAVLVKAESQSPNMTASISDNTNEITSISYYTKDSFMWVNSGSPYNGVSSDYTYVSEVLEGGKIYYLKLASQSRRSDYNASINSIELLEYIDIVEKFENNNGKGYSVKGLETDENGLIKTNIPFEGSYLITEIEAPTGYFCLTTPIAYNFSSRNRELTVENKINRKVIVHHYIKDNTGTYTIDELASDEEIIGDIGERYTTSPKLDIENYELEKDSNGEYVIPSNATGTFGEEDIIVTYYYTLKNIPLTIHHYIEGTTTPVTLADGEEAPSEEKRGNEGESYITEPLSEEELNEKYELVEIPENAEGTYEYDEIIVNYYYKIKEYEITTRVKPITMRVYNKVTNMVEEQEVKGGTISGENEAPYETVTVKEDSVKDLIITPDEGFSVKTITINGEDVEFEPDENNIVTLPKFIQMRSNKNIQVEFMANTYSVLVHHYIDGTEIKVPAKDGQVVEDEAKQGVMDEIYATQISPEVHPMYEYVRVEGETSGEFGEEQKVVTYYYMLKHPEIETTIEKEAHTSGSVEITENVDIEDEVTETYPLITKEDEQITYTIKYNVSIEDYKGKATIKIEDELPAGIDIAKSDIQEGIYDEASQTITWEEEIDIDTFENGKYETEIEKEIKVSYKVQKTNEDLENTVKGTTIVYYPENHPEVDELEGPNKVLILDKKEDTSIVKQEYKARIQVKKIWNDNDNEREHRPESITVTIKSNHNNYKEVVLNERNEWQYEESDLPKYDENGEEINYTVEEKETNDKDLEFYRDVDIKKVIVQDEFETTNIFEIINGLSMDSKITKTGPEKITRSGEALNYEIHLDSIVTNHGATGKVKIVDTLPYKIDLEKSFLDGGVYDEETNTITWEEDAIYLYDGEGEEPDEEPTETTNIDNGDTEPTDNNDNPVTNEISPDVTNNVSNDVSTDVSNTITNEISNSVSNNTVQNEVTNETTEDDNSNNTTNSTTNNTNNNLVPVGAPMENDNVYRLDVSKYITIVYKDIVVGDGTIKNKVRAEIAIEDLELLDAVEDDTNTEMQIPGKVIVKYVDETTGKELASNETIEGLAGEPYITEEKEFEKYELKEKPENAEGEIKEGTTEVIYYYRYYTKVIVKYLEQNTNKVLAEETLIEGKVGDNYTTSAKAIEHFNFTYSTTNTRGKMTKEPIEVIYYYEWPHSENPEPTPNNETPSTTEKRSMVNRIVHPKTGDVVPVIAYSIIVLTIGINVMLLQFNKKELVRVSKTTRTSRMESKIEDKYLKGKRWQETKKGKRSK